MGDFLAKLAADVSPWLANILLGLIGAAVTWVAKWAVAESKSELFDTLLYRVSDATSLAVTQVKQTLVDALKAKAADGKLTPEEARHALWLALGQTKTLLAAKAVGTLTQHFGTPERVDDALTTYIEAEIHRRKALT